ncbi:MAG TPA: hypothetical protein VGD67_21310 [Pseudonocardiaceae bacterium]
MGRRHAKGSVRERAMDHRTVDGLATYRFTADGPVQYVLVAGDEGVLGYLWASDDADAAGFEARRSAGDEAFNAAMAWLQRLREHKAVGLPPSQAIAQLTSEPECPVNGRIVPASAGMAPSLHVLKELAAA